MCIVHVVNYNMSKFGFKILKLLNLEWKIASSITNLILIAGHYTLMRNTVPHDQVQIHTT
jgi:hypothetical protein